MKELYDLKEMLCKELKEYGGGSELSTGSLDVVDKLAHAIKNIDKIIETYEEEGYSGHYPYWAYDDGSMNRGSYRGRSYAGRRNARRDSMGRYSRDGLADKMRELMADAPDERTREEIRRVVEKIENT